MNSTATRKIGTESLCGLVVLLVGAINFHIAEARADTITDVTNIQAGGYGGLYIGNRAPLEPSPLLRLPPGSIQPQGWLLTMLQNQRNGLNGLQEQISPFLKFPTSDWTTTNGSGTTQGWERVPYWLRGYIDLGYCLQDNTVITNAAHWIKGVMNSERPNGYFGPAQDYSDGTINSDLGINVPDLWPNMPMLDAMRSYYDYTGDTNALNLIRNYCLWENSLPATDFGAGYWPMMRMGDNIESIYWLYNRTGRILAAEPGHEHVREHGAVGHAQYPAELAQREYRRRFPRSHRVLAAIRQSDPTPICRGQLSDRHESIWPGAGRGIWRG